MWNVTVFAKKENVEGFKQVSVRYEAMQPEKGTIRKDCMPTTYLQVFII